MISNDLILKCKNVTFYGENDQNAFFNWVNKIDCIDSISGDLDELYLYLAGFDLHDADLRDLLGLFYRYKIDMKQLQRFLTKKNRDWFFGNKHAYWHRSVFGPPVKLDKAKQVILICRIKFNSITDKEAFFEWIKEIRSIVKIKKKLDLLHFYFASNVIPNRDLQEIISLFYRYRIDMKQLVQFMNEKNKRIFAPWKKEIFG